MSACMAPYPTIVPYLAVADAAAAIDFYKRAFGAEERLRVPGPDRSDRHARRNPHQRRPRHADGLRAAGRVSGSRAVAAGAAAHNQPPDQPGAPPLPPP